MLQSENIVLKIIDVETTQQYLNLQIKNKEFFEKYSITRPNDFYSFEGQKKVIEEWLQYASKEKAFRFGIFSLQTNELIGAIDLSHIVRGPKQSGMVGYVLDKDQNGKGYATEAVKLIVKFAFDQLQLHRIEAGVMPHNIGSIKVLEKCGFGNEGLTRKNVKINGNWEDHYLLAIINPND